MPNIVVIAKDDRVRRQIEQFLNELEKDDLRFATFKQVEEFEALYYKDLNPTSTAASDAPPADSISPVDAAAPPPPPEAEKEEEIDLRLFSEVHLVIFALDSIGGAKPGPWIDKARYSMKRYKHLPEDGHQRYVLLKYEDDGLSKLDVMHPTLDDLIYLPLDRLIFLQKIEIIMTLPKLASPSFLFNQEVKHAIEISKIVKLDRLSDVGMAIRNPVALKRGLPGKFYLTLPGEKSRLELKGKVIRSDPHPDFPGQFLVYFGFFGLSKPALAAIRRTLAKAPRYQSLLSEDRESIRHRPDDLFSTPESNRVFNLAVIDSDEAAANALAMVMTKEMDRLHVATESSYSLFLYKYFSPSGAVGHDSPPKPTEATDFYWTPISLSISASDLKCLSVDPGPSDTDKFLGHEAMQIFASPERWLSLLQDKESRLIMEESLQLAARGRVLDKLLTVHDATNHRRAVNFKIYKSSAEHIVTVEMSPAGLDDIMAKMTTEATSKSLDLMIVDATFVPEDSAAWIEGLRTRALQLNLVQNPADLKFMIVADHESRQSDQWLNSPDILALLLKPVDNRQMLYFLSEILGNHNTLFSFNNLGWSSPGTPVHVAKSVQLEALSEFGATLLTKQKIAPGSVFYLRKSIYDNAPNACLAARAYMCNEHSSEKGSFQVYATYFGINEAFLKYARTWIRENYAQQKSQGE